MLPFSVLVRRHKILANPEGRGCAKQKNSRIDLTSILKGVPWILETKVLIISTRAFRDLAH